jgi:hypothetical protein
VSVTESDGTQVNEGVNAAQGSSAGNSAVTDPSVIPLVASLSEHPTSELQKNELEGNELEGNSMPLLFALPLCSFFSCL